MHLQQIKYTVFDLISEHTLISGHPPHPPLFCAGGDYCQST